MDLIEVDEDNNESATSTPPPKEPPTGEPPPQPGPRIHLLTHNNKHLTGEEEEWLQDLITTIEQEHDIKPKIATIKFEDNMRPLKYDDNDYTPPFQYHDSEDNELEQDDAFPTYCQDCKEEDILIDGEIMTGDDMEDYDEPTDPIMNVIKNVGILNQKWTPNLASIEEENKLDINFEHKLNDNGMYTSKGKLREKYKPIINKIHDQLEQNRGIYRMRIDMRQKSAQNDGGANRSVTGDNQLLIHYKEIKPYPIGGVKDGEPAIYCTGVGYLPWRSQLGELILVRTYFCSDVNGTILSPTDIVTQYKEKYYGWNLHANVQESVGELTFLSHDGTSHLAFSAYMENNLWFHYLDDSPVNIRNQLNEATTAIARKLTDGAAHELWHHRLGHPGHKCMDIIHSKVDGVPKLRRNQFYCCAACITAKFRKSHIGEKKKYDKGKPDTTPIDDDDEQNELANTDIGVGQHLHMDYGFVRGSDWSKKDNDGKLVTSVDNYRSYLLVIDKRSRYIWIFLTKTKSPPLQELDGLLQKWKDLYKNASVTVDQGELGNNKAFTKILKDNGYTLRPTGADSSAQNGMAECPNQDLGNIMRALLFSANLGSEYWSYALRHAVYLRNRRPHSALQYDTPYTILNGKKPNLSKLKVFGAKVQIKNSGKRRMKLDRISKEGTFMTYTGTDKIVYVVNNEGKNERSSTHVSYDEAHMSSTARKMPPMATALQQAGYRTEPYSDGPSSPVKPGNLRIRALSDKATVPSRGSNCAAGMDIYSAENCLLKAGEQKLIHTDIAVEIPTGFYGQLKSRSGLALKKRINIGAGVIDSDYRGEVCVIMENHSTDDFEVQQGDRIAQMIILETPAMKIEVVDALSDTARATGGFGSTGMKKDTTTPTPLPPPAPNIESSTAAAAVLNHHSELIPPCNVELSLDPFHDCETIEIDLRGKHPTAGLILCPSDEWNNLLQIKGTTTGSGARRIKQWLKRIKGSHLMEINKIRITSIEQATQIIMKAYSDKATTIHITVSQDAKRNLHHEEGIPLLYFDQLNMINEHLHNIKTNQPTPKPTIKQLYNTEEKRHSFIFKMMDVYAKTDSIHAVKAILPKSKQKKNRLTRKKVQSMSNWSEWQKSEYTQLDAYDNQKTFGAPCKLPVGANVLDLLWTYIIKEEGEGRKKVKARCVCNGKPSNKNTVIFGHTFAKMLDHVGSRTFWAAAATKDFVVRGADASNAFAEANAPKIPLYVRIDTPFREWWVEKKGRPPIPPGYVLPVKKALQGHPESSRSWALLIDKILRTKLNLTPTTHEPCLYYGTHKGKEVLFLRQVDDFAVAAEHDSTNLSIIQAIDKEMTIDIKDLGRLVRYNGVDIQQTKHYIKLHNETYVNKIQEGHDWLQTEPPMSNVPIPMQDDKEFLHEIEHAKAPETEDDKLHLQVKMGYNYRQVVGELIFLMVTCRPDISYPLIKLSQYSTNPAEIHYKALKQVFRYIVATKSEGIYFWRSTPNEQLPTGPIPLLKRTQHPNVTMNTVDHPTTLHGAVDADWGGDTSHRRSVTGIILRLAGGTIVYKTKFQDTIAMSSTEAEFTAACDAGKAILYVRSILDEINIKQDNATSLFIDNNGALMMANAQQPTRRTRHMDIRKFALIDWVERDLLTMKRVSTTDNYSDAMTKPLGRTLFHKHNDFIMGKHVPSFASYFKEYFGNQFETEAKDSEQPSPSIQRLVFNRTWGGYHT